MLLALTRVFTRMGSDTCTCMSVCFSVGMCVHTSSRYTDMRVDVHGHTHAIMQVVRLLLALKRDYPGRVVLIIGNR